MVDVKKTQSTQNFVPIEEVRDGIVVLKEGGLRGVLMASSLNLALKSQDEQEAILFQFQNFLNSLDFTIQLFVQSRALDIRPYIALLEERYTAQTNELMKIQVREYIDFIKTFTEGAEIMTKHFFVVVPYTPAIFDTSKAASGLFKKKKTGAKDKNATFEENRSQLEQRLASVQSGLSRTGVRAVKLGTEEVVELFYKMFNLGELDRPIPINQQR